MEEWRWPNFSPKELSCPCCGEYYHCPLTLDRLQKAREIFGDALSVNSAHRCRRHNRRVGGALNSCHLRIAIDLSLRGRDRHMVHSALVNAGFTTFGFYNTFIHTDIRPYRRWYGKGAKQIWTS